VPRANLKLEKSNIPLNRNLDVKRYSMAVFKSNPTNVPSRTFPSVLLVQCLHRYKIRYGLRSFLIYVQTELVLEQKHSIANANINNANVRMHGDEVYLQVNNTIGN